MSESSRLELHVSDSQVLAPLDSVSLPSEPPDIRNWFSSYIYESPELNTLDGFLDRDGSRETCLEEDEKGKSRKSQPVGESEDGLLAAVKESIDGIVMCNESDESECNKSTVMVTGSSESLSFSSEPPDITNWFSSYLYESPQLDTAHEFTMSDYECEDKKIYNAQHSCRQDNKDVVNIIDDGKHTELSSQSRISDVVVKCTNLVNESKQDHQSVCKDDHNIDPNPTLLLQGPVKKFRKSPEKLNIENNTGNTSVHIQSSCIGKENVEPEVVLENGFISTRKKNSHENTGNTKRHARVTPALNREKVGNVSRKVLSETSNLHFPNVQESTGKWRCPQKNKPNRGPPLKQLRLEQWVRRV